MELKKIGTLLMASMITFGSFAQKETVKRKEMKTEAIDVSQREKLTSEQKATQQTERLHKHVTLSDEQKEKIYEINLMVNNKNQVVRENKEMTKEFKKDSFEGNNKGRDYLIRETLTDEQKVKFDAWKAKQAENHHGHESHDGHDHN